MSQRLSVPLATWAASGWVRVLVGGVFWIVTFMVALQNPFDIAWAKALLTLSPLVLFPLGLRLVSARSGGNLPARLWRAVIVLQLPAALLFGAAYLFPQGLLATGLSLPWLATTGLIALCGLLRVWRRGLRPLHELCVDAALIYVVVGGAWAVSDRLGFRPLDFDPAIVLLTAIHFHYAGFILPLVTGFAARQLKGSVASLASGGVIAGIPLLAVGITGTQLGLGPVLECFAAWVTAMAAILSGYLHVRLALQPVWPRLVRCLWTVSALSLAGSMVLAAAYGSRFYAPLPWLDIPWMRAFHGTANAFGFGLLGLLAWTLAKDQYSTGPETVPSTDQPKAQRR